MRGYRGHEREGMYVCITPLSAAPNFFMEFIMSHSISCPHCGNPLVYTSGYLCVRCLNYDTFSISEVDGEWIFSVDEVVESSCFQQMDTDYGYDW
jgi:hypothetical protein